MTSIRGLAEVALSVEDIDAMQAFYEKQVGLPLMKRFPHAAFFRLAEGFRGHTQVLALFDRSDSAKRDSPRIANTTLDHFAFAIDLEEFDSEFKRLESIGLKPWTVEHAWVQWRSLYFYDPEGNTVEFVCFDDSIDKE